MGRKIYDRAWRKEVGKYMNFPNTFDMSDAMRAWAAQNRHKPKLRETRMCQACGAVSIIGSDRLREANENAHGAFYCDRECAEADRGRVYRTSKAYQEKLNVRYEREGKKREWQNAVCVLHYGNCKVCSRGFCANNPKTMFCSAECIKADTVKASWLATRRRQSPKEVHCAECGVWFTALIRTHSEQHYCSRKCSSRYCRRAAKHTRRERHALPNGSIRGGVSLMSQFKKHKGQCQICGIKVTISDEYRHDQATVDHIVPLSKGGLHVEDNVQLACHSCNSTKGDSLVSDRQLLLY